MTDRADQPPLPTSSTDQLFAQVASRYELLNRLLSWGGDRRWRIRAAEYLPPGLLLDLGSGTGSGLDALAPRHTVALDPVYEMLRRNPIPTRVIGRGEALPFADQTFSGVFSAYTFRNLTSIPDTLSEINRVLSPGGKAAVVDLSRPTGLLSRRLHRWGTAAVLPLVGGLAGSPREYWYLHRSLDKLPAPEVLFGAGPLRISRLWRMGPFGFVYGVVLEK